MEDNVETYKIGAIFELLCVSSLGYVIPILLKIRWNNEDSSYHSRTAELKIKREHDSVSSTSILDTELFRIIKSFSTGVILGVAMIHLFPDSVSVLGEISDYPLSFALASMSLLLTLGLEHFFVYLMHSVSSTPSDHSHNHSHSHTKVFAKNSEHESNNEPHNENDPLRNCGGVLCLQCNDDIEEIPQDSRMTKTQGALSNVLKDSNTKVNTDHEDEVIETSPRPKEHVHMHGADAIADIDINKAMIKAMVMEVSIAIHSVIIGFDLGVLTDEDLPTIQALMIAFAFHQFFEGISLGTAVSATNFTLSFNFFLGCFFSLTVPFGILLGMFLTSSENGETIAGIANAIAAGSLMYTGLIEMAAEDFSDSYLVDRPLLKLKMYIALCIGCFCMAILAIWA